MFCKTKFLGRIMKYQDEFLAPFLSEAVEASGCYFFQNWLMKLKCPNLLKPLDTIIQENYQPFYPSEPFRFTRFNMRHPVLTLKALIRTRLAQKLRQFLAQFSCPLLREFPNSWCTMQQGIKPSCFLEIRRWSILKKGKMRIRSKPPIYLFTGLWISFHTPEMSCLWWIGSF